MPARIVLMLGSVRPGRMVERVSTAVKSIVSSEKLEPTVLDPLDLPFDILKVPLHWMPDPTKAPTWMQDVNEKIKSAHGFIVVSPEYNSGIPPALTNMMNHFAPDSFRHRPCGIVTYSLGVYGGIRSSVALRPFLGELGMVSTPFYVAIPYVNQAITEDGTCSDLVSQNLTKLVKEVNWYANALQNQKTKVDPPK